MKINDIGMLTPKQREYPDQLRQLKDPPKVLYYIGDIGLLSNRCVSVVGSRTTTVYGRNTARRFGEILGRSGITVVSGMAAGIDSCAHEGALAAGGKTIAVLGNGPDICYPAGNKVLKSNIERNGLILSEYKPGTEAQPYQFPRRNRIISGLSEATIVVQARNRSGALITAELAAEQGRDVYSVPGNIDSSYNLGTNKLIRDGAIPLISVEEILEVLGINAPAQMDQDELSERLSETEYRAFDMIRNHGEVGIDEICRQMQESPAYMSPILSALEIKGYITSAMGKFFLANPQENKYNRIL